MDRRRQARGHRLGSERIVTELLGSGRVIERVMGELSYLPHTRPDLGQEPLREHGTRLVMEYSPHHEGTVLAASEEAVPGGAGGGKWYMNDMPGGPEERHERLPRGIGGEPQ